MKNNKATGPDNIAVELVKELNDFGVEKVAAIANKIYNTGHISSDLSKSVVITLPKQSGASECELHRTISLMSYITKLIPRILLNRMETKIRQEISQEQNAYMKGKGTRNAIFVLRMLAERALKVPKDMNLCFIDYSKAFDKVRHEELFRMLEAIDIDGKDLQIVRNLYWEQTATIRIGGETGKWTSVERSVRQGCVLSPDLFNLYSEVILRETKNMPGVKIGGVNINT